MASEFNQLQFYVTQSQGHPLVESIRGVSFVKVTYYQEIKGFTQALAILLVASCYGDQDKLQTDGPLGSYTDFTFFPC